MPLILYSFNRTVDINFFKQSPFWLFNFDFYTSSLVIIFISQMETVLNIKYWLAFWPGTCICSISVKISTEKRLAVEMGLVSTSVNIGAHSGIPFHLNSVVEECRCTSPPFISLGNIMPWIQWPLYLLFPEFRMTEIVWGWNGFGPFGLGIVYSYKKE